MNLRNFLFLGAIGLATITGCATQKNILNFNNLESYVESPIQIRGIKIIPIRQNSIEMEKFDFDPCFDTARKIRYKQETLLRDYMQTPEETAKFGTGDCEDLAIYLSKLLTDKRINNEIVFGQIHRSDGLRFHVWNRVIEKENRYLLDATAGTRILENEIPKGYYNEFTAVRPRGYSRIDMRRYSIIARQNESVPALRIIFNGDPTKKIFGENLR